MSHCKNKVIVVCNPQRCIGPQGLAGIGTQGPIGFQGSSGTQGGVGTQGFQGLSGLQGFQGEGTQGQSGTQGSSGFQGDVGPQGFQGPAAEAFTAVIPYSNGLPPIVPITAIVLAGGVITTSDTELIAFGSNFVAPNIAPVTPVITIDLIGVGIPAFAWTAPRDLTLTDLSVVLTNFVTVILGTPPLQALFTVTVLVETGVGTNIFAGTALSVSFVLSSGANPINVSSTSAPVPVAAEQRIILAAYWSGAAAGVVAVSVNASVGSISAGLGYQ